jgi:hypothetical protein
VVGIDINVAVDALEAHQKPPLTLPAMPPFQILPKFFG